jgi:hypothetical protein
VVRYLLAVLPDTVHSSSQHRVFTAKVIPEWCLQHCTSVENTYRIGSALVALVAVDIFEPEEFSAVCVVQCFALHLLAPYPNTNC